MNYQLLMIICESIYDVFTSAPNLGVDLKENISITQQETLCSSTPLTILFPAQLQSPPRNTAISLLNFWIRDYMYAIIYSHNVTF